MFKKLCPHLSWMNQTWPSLVLPDTLSKDPENRIEGHYLDRWLIAQKFWVHYMFMAGDMDAVMVNYMCQSDWATVLPDIWSNIILSEQCFWMRLTSNLVEWAKQTTLPNVCQHHAISWSPEWNQKANQSASKGILSLPDCFELRHWSFLAFKTELIHQLCEVSD